MREFAERILFGRTLDEKLAPPDAGGLVDERRGSAVVAPKVPERPDELRLTDSGVRAEFPGMAGIADERERGRLLHFFANHELLATELMALVLLKFPDAPADFRAGVVDTLREEQMHTKLYLRRMAECGVSFGEVPVNGYFWHLVSPMETPLDYVTRLSLTFEQANLDYSKGYARVFSEAGDADTAKILERIYRDEIGHVSYGLEWFRKWHGGESDWKSFCSLLEDPLSAARAKGKFGYNEAGRREAGLDEEFIRELKVFSRSKGRTPDVYWFLPGAEDEVAGRNPDRASRRIQRDLEMLLAVVARSDDVVLVEQVPETAHLTSLVEAGVALPELVAWDDLAAVQKRKLRRPMPWAATPTSVEVAASLGFTIKPTAAACFSKAEQTDFLRELLGASDWSPLIAEEAVGVRARSCAEVAAVMAARPDSEWVIKAPISTAGRERRRVHGMAAWGERERQRVERMLAEAGEVVVEPWLARELDFSLQYDRDPRGGMRRRGVVVLENTVGGQFCAARVTRRLADFLPSDDRRGFFQCEDGRGAMVAWLEDVFEPRLDAWLGGFGYHGPVGVDALTCRDRAGRLRLKPVVEINPRWTMGRVAVELDRFRARCGESELRIQPLERPAPEGALRLTPVEAGTRWAAYWQVWEAGG